MVHGLTFYERIKSSSGSIEKCPDPAEASKIVIILDNSEYDIILKIADDCEGFLNQPDQYDLELEV